MMSGAGCYSWCIINGESTAGITLHLIDEGIDSGDIIEIRKFPIEDSDTAHSLYEKGSELMFAMFKEWFVRILEGKFTKIKQREENSRLYYRRDLHKIKDLSKYIRALHFPGKESAFYFNSEGDKIYINFEDKGEIDERY